MRTLVLDIETNAAHDKIWCCVTLHRETGEIKVWKDSTGIKEYLDGFLYNKETYYETENYYIEVDSILNTEPLLRADWVATYYNTKFI